MPPCEFPNSLLEPCHRFRRQAPLRLLVVCEAEPQESSFPWSSHRTLLAVHSKLELRREESRHTSHHSFTGPSTADVNVAVIRISGEPMSTPLQLLIQFVKYDVRSTARMREVLLAESLPRSDLPARSPSLLPSECPTCALRRPLRDFHPLHRLWCRFRSGVVPG